MKTIQGRKSLRFVENTWSNKKKKINKIKKEETGLLHIPSDRASLLIAAANGRQVGAYLSPPTPRKKKKNLKK